MKNNLFSLRYIAPTLFLALLGACSTTKVATDELKGLHNLQPPADMALIYCVRPVAGGGVIRMHLSCDGTPLGSTQGKQFVYAYVKPGKHEFVSKAENKDEVLLVVEAGKTYFLEQKVQMGIVMARNKLERIEDAEGRKKLAKCKLSSDCPAYTPVQKQ